MAVHEYRPGSWTALVTDDAVALLHPGVARDVVRELWQLTSEGRRLGAWVEYLAASGLSALPSFAMAETHPQGVRVLVRGEVDVTVEGTVLSGRDYTTWREEILPATGQVTLTTQEDDGVGGDEWFPVVGGIVRAGAVRVATVPSAQPVTRDDDVELTVARMPALAAAVGTAQTTPSVEWAPAQAAPAPAAAAAADPDSAPAADPEPAVADPAPAADPDPAPAAPAADPDPAPAAPAVAASEARAADTEGTAMAAPAGALPGEDLEPEDDYDFLLWPTEQAAARRDERQAEAAEEESAAASDGATDGAAAEEAQDQVQDEAGRIAQVAADIEATRAPEPEDDQQPAQAEIWTIIDSVPGRPSPTASGSGTPAPVGGGAVAASGAFAAAPTDQPAAPTDQPAAPAPPTGSPVDLPPPDDGDHDGQTVLTSEIPHSDVPVALEPPAPAAPTVELVLSTGPRIEMARPVLIGRAPESARFAGSEPPRLVSVPGPDVSATHVEIRPARGHVVVTDMNSTNGTVVHLPDQPAFRLQPGTGVPVSAGALIEIGADVTIRVDEATA